MIVYEGFDYAPGESLEGLGYAGFSWGTNVWLKHYATSDWLTFSGSLAHPSLPTSGGHVAETNNTKGADYERRFGTHILGDGDSVWFSFLVRIAQGATWNLSLTSSGLPESQVSVEGDYFNYSIQAQIGTGYPGSTNLIELGQNTTRLVVGRYLYSASSIEQLDVWVDPDIGSEPQTGGLSTSNHIVHTRQLDSKPDRIDSVLLEDRSIGSFAFDELRVGTSWADVTSRAVDKALIEGIAVDGETIRLDLHRLTPGATTTVERATELFDAGSWMGVDTFVSLVRATNWVQPFVPGAGFFYRIHTK